MNLLAFDCSGEEASVAIYIHNQCQLRHLGTLRDQGAKLIPCIEQLFQDYSCQLKDFDAILTTRGPGSFTGLRVGLASAQGLSIASGVPVYAYTVFQVMTFKIIQAGHKLPFFTTVKTAQNDFFQQKFDEEREHAPFQGPLAQNEAIFLRNTQKENEAHFMPIDASDLLKIFKSGKESWKMDARENANTPLYIRPPDVTIKGQK